MERKQWLDNIRVLACLMVLVVHVTAITKYSYGKIDDVYWYITVFLDSASRMCVPLFLMISGYLFLGGKKIKPKNLLKIFTALTFYSFFSVIFYSVYFDYNFIDTLLSIYEKPAMYHLWYMFYIFSFYILFMIIDVRKVSPLFGLMIVVIVMTILNDNLADINNVLFGHRFRSYFVINAYYLQLFMYCFAGYFIGTLDDGGKYIKHAWVVCIISIAAVTTLTLIKSFEIHKLHVLYQQYNSVPVFFSALSAFYIVKNSGEFYSAKKYIKFISERSLAIYGVHAIILEVMKYNKYYIFSNPLANIISSFFILSILSVAAASLIKRYDKKGYVS
ncbi:acyltransferase family protein [Enterobacteriaceae bacterium RIT711]|nr:acyltransferase family protein [Enterobacteriaceae bacterium RIT711]